MPVATSLAEPEHCFDAQERLLSGVDRDLAPFKESGITLEMVEQVYCTYNVQSFRVQVGFRHTCSL